MLLNGGEPALLNGASKVVAVATCFKGCVDDVCPLSVGMTIGVVGVLEARADQYFWAILKNIYAAVAVVDIEVEDGDPVYINVFKRCHCPNSYAVEYAKSHGIVYFRVMSWWPNRAEDSGVCIG